jgi:hypothetical protein
MGLAFVKKVIWTISTNKRSIHQITPARRMDGFRLQLLFYMLEGGRGRKSDLPWSYGKSTEIIVLSSLAIFNKWVHVAWNEWRGLREPCRTLKGDRIKIILFLWSVPSLPSGSGWLWTHSLVGKPFQFQNLFSLFHNIIYEIYWWLMCVLMIIW